MRNIIILVTLLLVPAGLQAQRLVGRAIEARTEKPVPNVEVRLDNANGPVTRIVTDSAGRFVLRVSAPGSYKVSTNHIAFAPVTTDVVLGAGDQIEIVLRMAMTASELPPVEVIARSRAPDAFLERNGFYDRKASGFGVFRTREDIEKRRPQMTSDLFQGLNGLRVFHAGIAGRDIRMTRGEDPDCTPRVIIDNVIVRRGGRSAAVGQEPILDALMVNPNVIQAIEIYRSPSETPQEYGGNQTGCGVVVFWTQRGSAR